MTWVWDISRDRGVVELRAHTEGRSRERETPVPVPARPARLPLAPADKGGERGSEPRYPEDNRAAPAPGRGQCEEFHVSIWNLLCAVVVASL